MKKVDFVKIMSGLVDIGSSSQHFVRFDYTNRQMYGAPLLHIYIFQITANGEAFICDKLSDVEEYNNTVVDFIEKWTAIIEEENHESDTSL